MKTICECGHEIEYTRADVKGAHYVLCGDATKKEDVERLMQGEKADMVFTDPPYGIDLQTDFRITKGFQGRQLGSKWDSVIGDDIDYDPSHLFEFWDKTKQMFLWGADFYSQRIPNWNNGSLIVWDKTYQGEKEIDGFNAQFELCWSKEKHRREVIHFAWFQVFGLAYQDIQKRLHPTQKPLQVIMPFLTKHSEIADIVADPFGGSGSTLIACEKLGRKCRMMEIDEHYCDVIIQRWQNYTGKQAVKL